MYVCMYSLCPITDIKLLKLNPRMFFGILKVTIVMLMKLLLEIIKDGDWLP